MTDTGSDTYAGEGETPMEGYVSGAILGQLSARREAVPTPPGPGSLRGWLVPPPHIV